MSLVHQGFHLQIESAPLVTGIDANAIADAFTGDLFQENVTQWANDVRTAIESARCISTCREESTKADQLASRKTAIETQIAKLQKQLQELVLSK